MRRILLPLALLVLLFLPSCQAQEAPNASQSLQPIEVFFSPTGGCTEAVVKEIDAAKSTILVQAYSFTSVPIAKALVDAHKRGVKIQMILDKSQRTEKYSSADFVLHAGIPTFIDAKHAIAHNKVMVIGARRSSPAASTSPRPPRRTTPRTCWSSGRRNWRRSTPPTGKFTPTIPSSTPGARRDIPRRTPEDI